MSSFKGHINKIRSVYYAIESFVTTATPPPHTHTGAGRGIAVEMSGVFTKAFPRQCGGTTRGLHYIVKEGSVIKT